MLSNPILHFFVDFLQTTATPDVPPNFVDQTDLISLAQNGDFSNNTAALEEIPPAPTSPNRQNPPSAADDSPRTIWNELISKKRTDAGVTIRPSLIPMTIPDGDGAEFKVHVVFAPDPTDFSVQLDTLRPLEECLHGMMKLELEGVPPVPKEELKEGDFYAGYNPEKVREWSSVHSSLLKLPWFEATF